MSEQAEKNKTLALVLGYIIRRSTGLYYELLAPDGTVVEPPHLQAGVLYYRSGTEETAWLNAPDFYGSVDALKPVLQGKHVVLTLDYADNSAMLTDFERGDGMDRWVFTEYQGSVEASAAECVLQWAQAARGAEGGDA